MDMKTLISDINNNNLDMCKDSIVIVIVISTYIYITTIFIQCLNTEKIWSIYTAKGMKCIKRENDYCQFVMVSSETT